MARARDGERKHLLQAFVVDLARGARGDLRRDEKSGARAQQGGDDCRLQLAAFGDGNAAEKSTHDEARGHARGGEPGQRAAAGFDQYQSGEDGRGHGFVCRLVAGDTTVQPAIAEEPLFARLANSAWGFSQRYWRLVLVAMLALLHVAASRGVADPWARALLLAHLGLLLLWQPFLRAEQRVSPAQGLILSLVAFVVMLWLDWWLLAFWVVVIAGLVGGKVYQQHAKWQRRCYLVVLAYLLALLAVGILPEIAPRREIDAEIRRTAEYALPLAFLLIALFPGQSEARDSAQVIDFFYSVFLMLLLVVVILGSFTFMTLAGTSYLSALTATVFLTAAAMLLVGLAWNPRSGGGLGVFFARYLFSIGLPVEKWLQVLAELSQIETRPQRFLDDAVRALHAVPSVSAVRWQAGDTQGERGERTAYAVAFANSELALTIYSRYRLGPALQWHLHLLGQLLGEFYVAKLRETELREASYLQAVHETRARTTHDIKKPLQSLQLLCSVAAGGRLPGFAPA